MVVKNAVTTRIIWHHSLGSFQGTNIIHHGFGAISVDVSKVKRQTSIIMK